MSNPCKFILETKAANIVITCTSVSKRSSTIVPVTTQIRTFSLNSVTFNKNVDTTKYLLKGSVQKE